MSEAERTARKRPVVPAIVALLAALVTVAVIAIPQLDGENARTDEDVAAPQAGKDVGSAATMARRQKDDPLALGPVDAPVVLVEYSDFQCPFCGRFARSTEPTLIRKYVRQGTLRIEWRDFPYLGAESTLAARAGRAAAEQDRFWPFHDAMYADQQPPNSGRLTESHLIAVARRAGLDTDRFRTAMSSSSVDQAVQRDFQEGQAIGVTGTPAFMLNGQLIMGAQPTDVFEQAIEDAAAAAR